MKRILKKIAYMLLLLALLCVFFYCGWRLIGYYSEGAQTQKEYDNLAGIMHQTQPAQDPSTPTFDWSVLDRLPIEEVVEMPESPYITVTHPETGESAYILPEFEELYAINPDIVGWISIAGTDIDYPVVQRKGQTDYYLYRDFYGKQVARGCIYADEECDVFAPSDNVVLYGHMMKDGSMFADLANYTSKKYWQEHQFVTFNTLQAKHTYQIICVFKTTATAGEGFAYHRFIDAEYDSEWDEFWQNCRDHAFYDTGLDLRYGDQIITLSTCEYTLTNGRLVVVAKRID